MKADRASSAEGNPPSESNGGDDDDDDDDDDDEEEKSSVIVLGRRTLSAIQDAIPMTELPSWINAVPSGIGTKARGKLSADQWHTLCVVHLPIILIRLWHNRSQRKQRMLLNFLDLVTEVVITGLLDMSEKFIQVYEDVSLRYLVQARKLYRFNITPNQHNSLHIPLFLRLFGPLHPIRTFFSERYNYLLQRTKTNSKFGESRFSKSE